MPPLFNEETNVTVDVKKAVAEAKASGIVEVVPCTFLISKEDAIVVIEFAPLQELLERAASMGLEKVSFQASLPEHVRGPYIVNLWDYHKDAEEQSVAFQGQPLVLEPVHLGSVRVSQHKDDEGLLKIETSLFVPVNSSEIAGEIDKCAGKKLVARMALKQTEAEVPEAEGSE